MSLIRVSVSHYQQLSSVLVPAVRYFAGCICYRLSECINQLIMLDVLSELSERPAIRIYIHIGRIRQMKHTGRIGIPPNTVGQIEAIESDKSPLVFGLRHVNTGLR